ncbi:MAG: nuclear transport factor 2 family protein [Myxococcota bacterium]|nr:nuclear transport factor 2 family protein [Myxococcota bacterium]
MVASAPVDAAAVDALASRFFAAIERGDAAALEALYAPGMVVWHNTTRAAQSREDNLALLARLHRRLGGWRYASVRREVFDGGFVQQHVLHATLPDGREVEVPACVVARELVAE